MRLTQRQLKKAWQILVVILLNILVIVSVAASPALYADALSKMGSRGTEVRQIQEKLISLGFLKDKADGIYGTKTKNAVIAFQKSKGLTPDGIAGPKTLKALGIGSSSSGSSSGSSDYNLLAKLISAEARGEPYEGQVAVGAVVLNRVKHPSFPDTIPGVVYQKGAFSAVTDMNWSQPVADSAYKAARDALNGWDPSGGAIYYYNPKTSTNKWITSRPVIKYIGNHKFCA